METFSRNVSAPSSTAINPQPFSCSPSVPTFQSQLFIPSSLASVPTLQSQNFSCNLSAPSVTNFPVISLQLRRFSSKISVPNLRSQILLCKTLWWQRLSPNPSSTTLQLQASSRNTSLPSHQTQAFGSNPLVATHLLRLFSDNHSVPALQSQAFSDNP